MLEKTMRVSGLYDFYEPLLTAKQRDYMSLYYLDDYSLGEIAEYFNVSRQAVYDTLRRTVSVLEDFESKLSLYAKFEKRSAILDNLKQLAKTSGGAFSDKMLTSITELEKLD